MVDANRFQTVTHQSWFGRLGGAIKGVLVGLVLLVVSFPLLFWNEGRAVRRYKTLVEGAGAVVSVSADQVDAGNEGRLVHLSGDSRTADALSDTELGIAASALKLRRSVEMLQWRERSQSEERKKLGGGTETVTTYEYAHEWSSSLIDSSQFAQPAGHTNPTSMLIRSRDFAVATVQLGAFQVSTAQVGSLDEYRTLVIGPDAPVPSALGPSAVHHDGGFYVGAPVSPQVGDLRVSFRVVDPGPVSLVARQVGDSFEPYPTQAGGTISLIDPGTRSAEAMFESAQSANTTLTWILRVVGFFVMFLGLSMMLRPLTVTADVIPMLGNLVGMGMGLIAFLLAGSMASVTIGIAWLVYRPLLGVSLLVVAVLLAVLVVKTFRSRRAPATG